MAAAQELDDPACWNRLGLEALRQGNQQIVEMVYQKTKNFDALSFLYLITGNITKLRKMLKIAELRVDVMSRFNNALMLGSVEERIKIMAEMGQVPLAALTAKAHNCQEFIPKLEEQMQGNDISAHIPSNARLLLPPVPLCRPTSGDSANWPLLKSVKQIIEESTFKNMPAPADSQPFMDALDAPEDTETAGAWGGDDLDLSPGENIVAGADWGDMDDLDLGADVVVEETPVEDKSMSVSMGDSVQTKWLRRRKLPADLVAAGEFEEALGLLKRRLGVINADPLEPLFKEAYWATCSALPTMPQNQSLNWPILSEGHPKTKDVSPMILFTAKVIVDKVKEGQKLTTQGKFGEALTMFRSALQAIPLSYATDAQEEKNLTEMIEWCREYVNFTRMEVARKQLAATDVARNIEMASYLTACKVQSKTHQCLALQLAMFTSFKNQNFVTAASFAKRLVQGSWGEQGAAIVPKARQVMANCEKNANDTHKINFDPKCNTDDMKLCVGSYTLMSATEPAWKCPFCGSNYKASYKTKLCETCQLSEIGANTLGIQLRPL